MLRFHSPLIEPDRRIETIDQPRSEAAAANQLDLFNKKTRRLDDFRNRLIWGDNKLVMGIGARFAVFPGSAANAHRNQCQS